MYCTVYIGYIWPRLDEKIWPTQSTAAEETRTLCPKRSYASDALGRRDKILRAPTSPSYGASIRILASVYLRPPSD